MNDEKDNLSTAKQEIAKKLMNSDKKYLSEAYTDGEEFEDFEEYGKGYEELYTSHGAQKIKKTKKITPVLDVLDAYVDGSFKDDIYSYGCVFLEGERVVKETSGTGDKHIKVGNISGEILAAEKAILWAISKGYKEIILYYDFEGVEKWSTDASKAKPHIGKRYKKFLRRALEKIKVTFIKVRAHSGNIWHNRADRLACLAREEKEKEKESKIEKELVAEN